MKISELMTTTYTTCRPEDNLDRAAQIMWTADCGCVPVVDREGQPLGMITDRDVCMAASFQGARLTDCQVQQAMSRGVRTCREDMTIEEAHTTMREHQLHRLAVVDRRGRLVGLVSLSDLVHRTNVRTDAERRELADELLTTFSSICRPRGVSAASLVTSTVETPKAETPKAETPKAETQKAETQKTLPAAPPSATAAPSKGKKASSGSKKSAKRK